jgi:hypothetical protein
MIAEEVQRRDRQREIYLKVKVPQNAIQFIQKTQNVKILHQFAVQAQSTNLLYVKRNEKKLVHLQKRTLHQEKNLQEGILRSIDRLAMNLLCTSLPEMTLLEMTLFIENHRVVIPLLEALHDMIILPETLPVEILLEGPLQPKSLPEDRLRLEDLLRRIHLQ